MSKEKRPIIVVKKVVKGHGHHGGAWKVAFADFMTAMMAFFLVMWIVGMNQSTKDAIQGYFQNPIGFSQAHSSLVNPIAQIDPPRPGGGVLPLQLVARQMEEQRYREIGERIEMTLAGPDGLGEIAAQVEIVMTEQGLRIELVEGSDGETFFALGATEITRAADRALQVIAGELRAAGASLVVEGHTDAAPLSRSAGYTNWELSADRANAARRALERHGLAHHRVAEIRGHADRYLRDPGNPFGSANRRISILLPFSTPPSGTSPVTPSGS